MKTHPQTLRTAAVALFATAAFLSAPVFGQAVPVVAPPPPVQAAPPPPVAVPPSPAARPAPAPRAEPAALAPATPSAQATRQPTRPAPRVAERSARPAGRSAPTATPAAPSAPSAAPPATAPTAETALRPVAEPASIAEPAPAAPASTDAAAPVADEGSAVPWLVAVGLALVIALAGFVFLRRRSAAQQDYYHEEPVYEEPAASAAASNYQPALVTPAFRRAEPAPIIATEDAASSATEVDLGEADPADVEALAAGSRAHGDRPWLEMLMRPIRAGAAGDDTVVEFSLTVGNTGGAPAEDVRISAWMLASGGGSEMESLLIDPPAGATLSETRIEAGDGATVEATVTLPRNAIDGAMLPIVVTDARYTLPNGGEGRTSASFAIGMPIGEELVPFPANPASGLNDGVEARVHGDVEHV